MDDTLTPIIDVAIEPTKLDFPDAMRAVIDGKRVARSEWANADYCLLKDGWLTILTKGAFHTWLVNDGDLEAVDWIILPDIN